MEYLYERHNPDNYISNPQIEQKKRSLRVEILFRVLEKHGLILKGELLDIGTGIWDWLGECRYIAEKVNIINLDVEKLVLPDVCGNCLYLPFRERSIDIIYSCNLIEHLQHRSDILKYIDESYRVLKPNGIMITRAPNIYKHPYYWDDPTHNIPCCKRTVEWAMEKSSFEILYSANRGGSKYLGFLCKYKIPVPVKLFVSLFNYIPNWYDFTVMGRKKSKK